MHSRPNLARTVARRQSSIRTASRRAINPIRSAVESLENRKLLDATYFAITPSASLTQDWSNPSSILQEDNWANVPSIVGFRGDDLTTTTGVNPQTVTTESTVIDLNLTVNNPDVVGGSGGVIGFDDPAFVPNPTVALAGSGTADAPYLQFHLNTLGVGANRNVRVSYNLRDLEAGVDNAIQQIAAQYRIGTTGAFIDIPAGYVADATVGGATQTTAVSFNLPEAAEGQSQVQVRVITTNAGGNDEYVGVDDISISSVADNAQLSFSASEYTVDEAAGTASVTVTRGGLLTGTASVTASTIAGGTATPGADYTVTSTVLTFGPSVTTQTFTFPIVNDTQIESAETVEVQLSNATNGSIISPSTATVTIVDNDAVAPAGVRLNEIVVDPANNDTPNEYIEIRGTPGTVLNNVFLVQFEGSGTAGISTSFGTADYVLDLSGQQIGSNGLLLVKSAANAVAPAGTTLVVDPNLTPAGTGTNALEDDNQTWSLIFSPLPITRGTDYDTNTGSPGTLTLPAGAQTLDSVGLRDFGAPGQIFYSPAVVDAANNGSVDAVTRFVGDLDANDASAWFGGGLIDDDLTADTDNSDGVTYNPAFASTNLPVNAVITPGASNFVAGSVAGAGQIRFSGSGVTVAETPVAPNTATTRIFVVRVGGSSGTVSATYNLTDVTTTAGQDYTAATTGTVTFAPGETFKTIDITVVDEFVAEVTETLNVTLSNPTGGATLNSTASSFEFGIGFNDSEQPATLLVNEARVAPDGSNNDRLEYIEIRGTPGTVLNDVYILSIDGDEAQNPGTFDLILNLSGTRLGANGLLIVTGTTTPLTPQDPATTVFRSGLFNSTTAGVLENGTATIFVAYSPSVITFNATLDWDTGNDGAINIGDDVPGDVVLLDGIAYTDGGANDLTYAPALAPIVANDSVDAFTRFPDNDTPFSAAAWYSGELATNNTAYATGQTSANFPVGGVLTPGALNAPGGDTEAPTVLSSAFNFLTVSRQNLTVTFSEDVGASLAAGDFLLTNLSTNTSVTLTVDAVTNGGTTARLVFTGTGNDLGATILLDGNYRLRTLAGQVADAAGNTLAGNVDFNFGFKNADFTSTGGSPDQFVDFQDLVRLAQNYGTGATFEQGDANYDGTVGFADLVALAQRYNTGIPVPLRAAQPTTSGQRITGNVLGNGATNTRSNARSVFGSGARIV